nr:hypothetical protein [Tanacetum cinerariifolium]
RSIKCIFVGYPKETMGYSSYYPPKNKVLVARNTEFLENSLINQKASGSLEDLEIIQEEDTHPSIDTSLNHEEDDLEIDEPRSDIVPIRRSTRTRHASDRYPKETMGYSSYYPPKNKVLVARNTEFLENSLINQKASGSLEDLEIIQEEDTHPSIDTSLNHEEDDLEIDEPRSDIVPIRRSTRTRHASDRMCLYIDAEEHELGDLVELPPNGKTIGSKWLFKKKTDMDGNVHIYKARLVVKDYTQTPRIDYEETFSPVVDIRAIRILIAIAAYYDYEI